MLATRLKKLRENKGWSKTEVARRLGMKASSTYSNWEYGNREPDLEMITKIAKLYQTSTDYLLGNEELNSSDAVAAHMDDDLTEEQKEEIYRYIEAIKIRDNNNEK